MAMLDDIMFAGVDTPASPAESKEEQASFSASPTAFNSTGDATVKGIVITMLFFYGIIYMAVIFERWLAK